MNTVDEEALHPLILSLLDEANSFPTDFRPVRYHGLDDPTDERGADGKLLLQFYAGLAVLARDMHLQLEAHPRQDAALFEQLIEEVHAEERQRWGEKAFPLYQGIPGADISLRLADAAAAGQPSIKPLGEPLLIHEWSTRPGALIHKRIVSALNRKGLQERVCGSGGFYEQYGKRQITAPELHGLLATAIMSHLASAATFWVPAAVLVTVILVRRGLRGYCGESTTKPATESRGEGADSAP